MQDHKNLVPGGTTDLPEEVTRRIDSMLERLGMTDYYTLLGLARTATRAQIRSAFLAVAPQFHPDKYFGRKLGVYGERMQRVFAEMSVACDTLVSEVKRAEYDRRLPPAPPPPPSPPPALTPPEPVEVAPPPPPLSERVPREAKPGETTERSSARFRTSQSGPELERAAQQAFAMRLGGRRLSTPMPGSQRAATPGRAFATNGVNAPANKSSPGMPAVDPAAAVEALKRRYEETKARGGGTGTTGKFAPMGAAKASEATKADDYATLVERAKDAETRQDYAEAGGHWAHAYELTPTAETANRAALCFRRAGSDSRRAAKYGEEAVKLDPNKAGYRANLALIYVDAGLALRARGELERAHKLDPQNAQVKEAAARVKAMK